MTRIQVQESSLLNDRSILSNSPAAAVEAPPLSRHCLHAHGLPGAAVMPRLASGIGQCWTLAFAALLLAATGARAQAVFTSPQPVGAISGENTVTVTAQAAGTVATVEVLTQGVSGLDFAPGIGANTCGTATFTAGGQTCTESVTFTPAAPGLRIGAVVLLDGSNNVLGTVSLSGTGSGGLGVLVPGNVIPVAGQTGYYEGPAGDGKAATAAQLYLPTSMTMDGAGNLYIADSLHNRIRMVCAGSIPTGAVIKGTYANCAGAGIIVTIAGNGNSTYTGDNGPASASTLNTPSGVALDGAGNLYIADTGNNVIRVISAATGIMTTLAGNGTPCAGKTDPVGDGCAATQALLSGPTGVTLDNTGRLYIADTGNQRIRMVAATNGIVTANSIIATVAGNGTMGSDDDGSGTYSGDNGPAIGAGLNLPYAVAFDAAGNMYIPDSGNNRVRKVTAVSGAIIPASVITTFAGIGSQGYLGDNAAATQASLWAPSGVAVDAAGNVFIADTQNGAIRKVGSPSSTAPGIISTLVHNASGNFFYNNLFNKIVIYGPTGLYLDGIGNLYVADTLNMVVREIQGNFVALQVPSSVRQGNVSPAQDQAVENDGNATFDLMTIVPATNAAVDDSAITNPCVAPGGTLAVAADCAVGAVFAPSKTPPLTAYKTEYPMIAVAGDTQTGVVQSSSPLNIELVGVALPVNGTTITVTSNNNPSGFGQSVTFTATVTTGAGTGNLTGTVTFFDGANPLQANVALLVPGATATATFTTTVLTVGTHTITASYNGDPTHFSSLSTDPSGATPPLTQYVQEGTATTLVSSQNPSAIGQNVTFTATVSIYGGGGVTPLGSVTFFDGVSALGTYPLTTAGATGVASYSTAALPSGSHSITARYTQGVSAPAIAEFDDSTSNTVTQWVQSSSSIAVSSSLNPSIYGNPVTFTATITPSGTTAAAGTVKFFDGAAQIGTGNLVGTTNQATFTTSSLNVATHSITATFAGDANNGASASLPYAQTVNQTQTSTTVAALPTTGIAGAPEAITATVKVVAGAATTSGQVTFTSGTTTLGAANLNTTTGTATINPVLAPGNYSIVATYAGDSNDEGSASTPALPLTVNQAATQTAVTATPNPALVQATVTFTAKVTGAVVIPTGTVTFSANGAQIGAPAPLDHTGTATIGDAALAAGSYTITAVYSGDTDNLGGAGTAPAQLVIGKIATTTDLGSSTTSGSTPQVILVAAVLPGVAPVPTGAITFNYGTTLVGTATLDSNGLATMTPNLPLGTYSIVAVYSGDALHAPSTSQPVTVSGTASGYNLAVTPATVTMATQQNATVTVTLTSIDGFADSIGLGCASLPAGVTCHFSAISTALAANGTATAKLTIDTNNPLTGGASAMNSHAGIQRTYLAGLCLPFSLFFGWLFWRFRKRHAAVLAVVLLLVLSGAAMLVTGCGGFSMNSAKPGTYVIQVTGTGANTNVIHYQNVTLTIT